MMDNIDSGKLNYSKIRSAYEKACVEINRTITSCNLKGGEANMVMLRIMSTHVVGFFIFLEIEELHKEEFINSMLKDLKLVINEAFQDFKDGHFKGVCKFLDEKREAN